MTSLSKIRTYILRSRDSFRTKQRLEGREKESGGPHVGHELRVWGPWSELVTDFKAVGQSVFFS